MVSIDASTKYSTSPAEVVIVSAVRTPIGRLGGALAEVRPDDLAALTVKEAVKRANIDPLLIEEVYLGCANQAGEDNRNVARMATLLAGLPESVAAVTVNRLCASGLSAVNMAARAILAGEGHVYVAGGVESMTRAPYAVAKNERAFGPSGNRTMYDTTLGWRFPNPRLAELYPLEAMGETAENIYDAYEGRISREDQDRFALQSQARAVAAINSGRFDAELVPVPVPQRRGLPKMVALDEHPRYRPSGGVRPPGSAQPGDAQRTSGTTESAGAGPATGAADSGGSTSASLADTRFELATDAATLATLKPAFRPDGTVTAGNSSGLNDGAAALVLMSSAKATELGVEPLAYWRASGASGISPRIMGLGPVEASRKALKRAGISVNDLSLVELNEAFAIQALAVLHELGIAEKMTNVNGGAIALGHPLGCSGARILTTLVHEMRRRRAEGQHQRYGLATLCVGVGQGEATVVELP